MKLDPHKHKERYLAWLERTQESIPGISKQNSEIIKRFMYDMERGLNIANGSKKGARSYIRLNTLRDKLNFFCTQFSQKFSLNCLTEVNEEQIHTLFTDMRSGKILRRDGKTYESTNYYVKGFKTFWHWWMKVQKKEGKELIDICVDLDTKGDKPKWVYLTENQIKSLCNKAKYEYVVLLWFIFDSGIRSPTELVNVKVSDLYNNCQELIVREEISKTFGRKIKLMLCPELLREYIKGKNLEPKDYLFPISPVITNRYLKRLGKKTLGDDVSLAGGKYSELTLYDFRHNAACYWLLRYKSESALKYRFGWKKSEQIHYYTELLGMKDTIKQEDLLIDVTKTDIEKQLEKSEREKGLLQERIAALEIQMHKILETTNHILIKINQ